MLKFVAVSEKSAKHYRGYIFGSRDRNSVFFRIKLTGHVFRKNYRPFTGRTLTYMYLHVSVNKQPSIGECTVKLSAKPKPDEDERVVAEASCADEELEPDPVWVGEGLNIGETKTDEGPPDKGLTKLEVIWKAEYTDPFPMPDRSRTKFFVKNTPPMIGITEGSYTVQFPGE